MRNSSAPLRQRVRANRAGGVADLVAFISADPPLPYFCGTFIVFSRYSLRRVGATCWEEPRQARDHARPRAQGRDREQGVCALRQRMRVAYAGVGVRWVGRNAVPLVQTAQAMRASLLARPPAAFFSPAARSRG